MMEILLLACFASISYLIILIKLIGIARVVLYSKWFDALFTVGVPLATMSTGTFSAIVLSVLSGLIFTLLTTMLSGIYKIKVLLP